MRIEIFTILPAGREEATWAAFDDVERRVVEALSPHLGRESAIHVPDLAEQLGLKPRDLQDLAKHLVEEHGIRIGKGVADGYFIITNALEGKAAANNHLSRALSNLRAFKALAGLTDLEFAEELDRIKGQLRLFVGGDDRPQTPTTCGVAPANNH